LRINSIALHDAAARLEQVALLRRRVLALVFGDTE